MDYLNILLSPSLLSKKNRRLRLSKRNNPSSYSRTFFAFMLFFIYFPKKNRIQIKSYTQKKYKMFIFFLDIKYIMYYKHHQTNKNKTVLHLHFCLVLGLSRVNPRGLINNTLGKAVSNTSLGRSSPPCLFLPIMATRLIV